MTDDGVYFADLAGFLYALDRQTGKERWKVDTRAKTLPRRPPAQRHLRLADPGRRQDRLRRRRVRAVVRAQPVYKGCTGRGYVVALDPKTGKIAWKYDVGPKPEPLDPPITIKDAWGEHIFHFGPATSTVWCTPSFDAATRTIFFGTDTNNAPRRPTDGRPAARHEVCLRGDRHRCRDRAREMGDADQPRRHLASRHAGLRPEGGPVQGPVDRRHAQGLHDRPWMASR